MFTPTVISLVLANTIVAVGPSSRLVSAFETARRRHSMGVKASEDAGANAGFTVRDAGIRHAA